MSAAGGRNHCSGHKKKMKATELQHYVPRFYLKQFADPSGKVWVFDKVTLRVFPANPAKVAAEKLFYCVSDSSRVFTDPRHIEKQLSEIEGQAAEIIEVWLQRVDKGESLCIRDTDREIMSLFFVLQMLRTSETRTQLIQFEKATRSLTPLGQRRQEQMSQGHLHADLLWDDEIINSMCMAIHRFIWILAHNNSSRPFYTSDHPIHCKTADSKEWITGPRLFDEGVYLVIPLCPSVVLYCKSPTHWRKTKLFDGKVSPVKLTEYMVDHENSGQVGMSHRFVFADRPDFDFARMFCELHPEIRNPDRQRFVLQDPFPLYLRILGCADFFHL